MIGADVEALRQSSAALRTLAERIGEHASRVPDSIPSNIWTGPSATFLGINIGQLANDAREAAAALEGSANDLAHLADRLEPLAARAASLQETAGQRALPAEIAIEPPALELAQISVEMASLRRGTAASLSDRASIARRARAVADTVGSAGDDPSGWGWHNVAQFMHDRGKEVVGGVFVVGGAALVVGAVVLTVGTDGAGSPTIVASGSVEEKLYEDEASVVGQGGELAAPELAAPLSKAEQLAYDYAMQPNNLNHIFAEKHGLDVLVSEIGSEKGVIQELLISLRSVPLGSDTFEVLTYVNGLPVVVTGRVVNGIVKIGTAYGLYGN